LIEIFIHFYVNQLYVFVLRFTVAFLGIDSLIILLKSTFYSFEVLKVLLSFFPFPVYIIL
jgi:hypothetical protein